MHLPNKRPHEMYVGWSVATDSDGNPCYWHNYYYCEECKIEWDNYWSCQCDDYCPECDVSYTPCDSVWTGPPEEEP